MSAILSFLAIIPKLLDLAERLGAYVEKQNVSAWLDDLDKAVSDLEKAQTPKEKIDAARKISSSIRTLR
jgi:hypothetical protein